MIGINSNPENPVNQVDATSPRWERTKEISKIIGRTIKFVFTEPKGLAKPFEAVQSDQTIHLRPKLIDMNEEEWRD